MHYVDVKAQRPTAAADQGGRGVMVGESATDGERDPPGMRTASWGTCGTLAVAVSPLRTGTKSLAIARAQRQRDMMSAVRESTARAVHHTYA